MPRKKKNAGSGLQINEAYAEEFERKKRKQELHRANSLGIDLNDDQDEAFSSTSESEDDNAVLLTKKIDQRIGETLQAIRSKDARVYDKNVKFFQDVEPEGEDGADPTSTQELGSDDEPVAGWDADEDDDVPERLTIKDYVRKEILEKGTLAESSSSEDEDDGQQEKSNSKVYDSEQKQLKDAIAEGLEEPDDDSDDSEDNFFKVKKITDEERLAEEKDYEHFALVRSRNLGKQRGEEYLLHSYLEKETTDDKERFLRDFIMNNGWLDKNKGAPPDASTYDIEIDNVKVEEEEEFLDQQDAAERSHNFRFEEDKGTNIVSYSRKVDDSARRVDDRRKQQRERKRLLKEQKKQEKLEEINRLKNLKKVEINERLKQLEQTSGGVQFDDFDLDEDFDPDKFAEKMAQKFGEDYYGQDEDKTVHPFQGESLLEDLGGSDAANGKAGNKGANHGQELEDEKLGALVEEYYDIDASKYMEREELKFKYKTVEPENYGLTMEQILTTDDQELNRIMPLKRLAPYRVGKAQKSKKRFSGSIGKTEKSSRKTTAKQKSTGSATVEKGSKKSKNRNMSSKGEKEGIQERTNRDRERGESKPKKRKKHKRKSDIPLSESRMAAYHS
ncbi:hypothetical protein NDN08_006690 [Rhodosorus marinus]|uniref:Kri1-like C-terminal domain-containing protein n=1 Tax=Rhodosorus marinus TaxID=101924 RepID=A0AAV8UIE8_9RHOD|nr:hypothetical protein NDN08_006690 [Rhodosorus marinus]